MPNVGSIRNRPPPRAKYGVIRSAEAKAHVPTTPARPGKAGPYPIGIRVSVPTSPYPRAVTPARSVHHGTVRVYITSIITWCIAHIHHIGIVAVHTGIGHIMDRTAGWDGVNGGWHIDGHCPRTGGIARGKPYSIGNGVIRIVILHHRGLGIDRILHGGTPDRLKVGSAIVAGLQTRRRTVDGRRLWDLAADDGFLGLGSTGNRGQGTCLGMFGGNALKIFRQLVGGYERPGFLHIAGLEPTARDQYIGHPISYVFEQVGRSILHIQQIGLGNGFVLRRAVGGDEFGRNGRHDDAGGTPLCQ